MSDLRMPDINTVTIAGRLCADPELRALAGGTSLCKLRLAASRRYKVQGEQKEETIFIDATAWRKVAEWCGENLQKGRPVVVEGRLKQDTWEDKETGKTRSKIEIEAMRVHALDWAADRVNTSPTNASGTGEIPEDDIPF